MVLFKFLSVIMVIPNFKITVIRLRQQSKYLEFHKVIINQVLLHSDEKERMSPSLGLVEP